MVPGRKSRLRSMTHRLAEFSVACCERGRARLEHVAALMNAAVCDCLVTGFESLEAGLTALPDPDDRHALAAAIHCGAQEIVTLNLHDFPETVLHPYWIRAVQPDVFA